MDLSVLKPEEVVRQSFIEFLVGLGYPKTHFAIEKSLGELPHLQGRPLLPYRRVDLLVYDQNLKPLLLVEFKADILDEKTLQQVSGYNFHIEAPYIALASKSGYLLFNTRTHTQMPKLPPYERLCLQA